MTPNIVQGCNIIGPGTVTAGTTYAYTLNCSDGSTAFSWDVLCGTATYWDGTEIDIIWNSSGCTSGKVTAKRSNGSMLATKTVIINPAPPPSITYTSLYNSSNFVKTIDLTKPVGTIPGLTSTTATGGVSYTIPLDLPVGTNGIKPNISLQYNSQGGNGIAGFGWNISGLSAIGRMGKNIYFNGTVAPVTYTSDDAFQLDGMRLSPVSGSNGANGTIYAGETEIFSQIISYTSNSPNNPDWFKVIAKDGSMMEFGHTTDSRILTDNSANVMLWRLNRIQDINGNYIDFVYDNTGRDSRISTIKYTGNSNAGLAPYNSITFNYKLRSDKNIYYDAGASLYSKYLLDQIKVIADDDYPARTYQLNYGYDNVTSLLKEIIETGSDNTSLNSTIFLYGDQPQNLSAQSVITNLTGAFDFYSGDFDGDGKTDLIAASYYYDQNNIKRHSQYQALTNLYPSNYSTLYTKTLTAQGGTQGDLLRNIFSDGKYYNFLAGDYNGDGRDDALTVNTSDVTVAATEKILQLNGLTINYTNNSGYTSSNLTYPAGGYQFNKKGNFFIPGDFDGDGNQDYILLLSTYPTSHFDSHLGTVYDYSYKAFLTSPQTNKTNSEILNFGVPIPGVRFSETNAGNVAGSDIILPGDFDGDGKTDVLVVRDQQAHVLIINAVAPSTGYSFSSSIRDTITSLTKDCKIFPGDFNGDHKTDLLVRNSSGVWNIMYSTGTSFITVPFTFQQTVTMTGSYSDDKIIVGDFNGDGKSDILHGFPVWINGVSTSSKFSLYYSTGMTTGFYYEQYDYNATLGYVDFSVGDFNGDGRSDLINHVCTTCNTDFISFKAFGQEKLLKKITDGHNSTTSFEYIALSDKSDPLFYTRTISLDDPSNKNPYNYIQLPVYAVSSFSLPDGIGGNNTTTFNYQDAVIHRAGKGFLGFKKVTTKNLAAGVTSVTENSINTQFAAPYITRQSSFLTSTSELLSESQITTSFTDLTAGGNKRFFEKTDKILNIDYLNGTASESANTYDSYGNITTNVLKAGTVSGNTVNATETGTTTTTYGIHNTPVPAKPDNIIVSKTRTGMPAVSSTTTFAYTTAGLVASKTEFAGLPKAVTTSFTYNSVGNPVTIVTSAAGLNSRTINFTYDWRNRSVVTKQLTGNNVSQTETFNGDVITGKPLSQTSSDCLTTSFQYDGFGRLKKTTLPEGYSINTSLVWDVQGQNVFYSFTDYPGGNSDVKTWFDKLGRETKTQTLGFNNQWLTQLTTYDIKGNVASKTNTYFSNETPLPTTNTYDTYNRLQSTSNTLASVNYTYTKLSGGSMQVTTQSAGQSSSKITDAAGKVVAAIDNGGELDFSYDSWGNQTQVVHGSNVLITTNYDSYGRQTSLADKNAGTVTYSYDAFGQLTQQTDANGNSYSMTYDDLGRIITRQGPEGTTTYEYYKDISTGCNNNNLLKVTAFNGIITQYTYDNLKRLQAEQVTLDGNNYITQYNYDSYSNLIKTTYPSGVVINNNYDANGVLTSVTGGNSASPTTLFTATQMNGLGQYTGYTLGNGKASTNTYYYGTPTRFYTQGIQDLNLAFDYTKGNLLSRRDDIKNSTENFQYDALNRLAQTSVNGTVQLNMNYDGNGSFSMGNITSKTDAGNYVYNSNKIHAVNYITNPGGAQLPPLTISQNQQIISYTPFLKTNSVTEGAYEIDYTYGADYQRVKSILKQNNSIIETKYYLGNYEKQISGGVTREIHYVIGGSGLCAIIERENGVNNFYFVYTDHLGSILTVTNISGTVAAEQNFDAWGRNRNPSNWQYASVPSVPVWFYRGYTGHEHLPQFALINMNGRMYDPIQGRMLSPDNYVPNPFSSQGYNRYAYANNNPLVYVDPDGNNPLLILGIVIGGFLSGIHADMQGKSFLGGFVKGAIVGGVAGALSLFGTPATLIGNITWGAGEGVFTNGLSNILDGKNFFAHAGLSAGIGAGFALLTSDNMRNFLKGERFRSNDQVLQRFVDKGEYQDALNYFDMNASFQNSPYTENGSAYRGYFDPSDQKIKLSEFAFKLSQGSNASFDLLYSIYNKELWHQTRWFSGEFFGDIGDNWPQPFPNWARAEDALGFAFQQKNSGAWSSLQRISPNSSWLGFRSNMPLASDFARQHFFGSYYNLFYHHGLKEFFYSLPRRFRFILL